jgi:hypothetical protein
VIAFKFLAAGAIGPFTGYPWPTPGDGPAAWVDAVDGRADHGIHACIAGDLAFWLHDELWVAELGDPVAAGHRQVVGTRGRLLRHVTQWDLRAAGEFAEACAWRARDRFVEALRRWALGSEADRLSHAGDLRSLRTASDQLRVGLGPAAAASAYLWEALLRLEAGDAAVSAYISARAAVAASDGDETAFAAEREEQGRMLALRLGLSPEGDGSSARP